MGLENEPLLDFHKTLRSETFSQGIECNGLQFSLQPIVFVLVVPRGVEPLLPA
jgi:hypothetical protein